MADKKIEVVKKKGVPLGKPLQLTDADLDRLSVITPMDIEEAKIAWRRNVPKKYKNLLDAEVKPTDANNQ
jgi:hypothetical protein